MATAKGILRRFYALSKTHHPDHNPTDPHAGRRFMRISEAYSVLGHADKRARYDRDVMRRHHNHGSPAPHRGSYHSTGPAGGRPASGLSRRRGTFTGPPPSFYRSGGWGSQDAKRRAAHDDSTGGAGGSRMGGMGPGQDPYGHKEDVPHFDRESHERTQQRGDERRARRRRAGGGEPFPDTERGVAEGFFVISGVLVAAVLLPYIALGGWRKDRDSAEILKATKAAKREKRE